MLVLRQCENAARPNKSERMYPVVMTMYGKSPMSRQASESLAMWKTTVSSPAIQRSPRLAVEGRLIHE